jgi:hypothetical protein
MDTKKYLPEFMCCDWLGLIWANLNTYLCIKGDQQILYCIPKLFFQFEEKNRKNAT